MDEYTKAEDMFSLLNASIWEELVTRVMLIGLPMAILGLILKKKNALKCMFGGFGISKVAIALIILSAVIFGLAHIPSWGLFKAPPTVFFGIISGCMYVRYGLHTSILIHFFTDYIAAFGWMSMDFTGGAVIICIMVIGLPVIIYLWREKIHNADLASIPVLCFVFKQDYTKPET
jgi:membrane protease YdiL (CAAX protease family)